MPRLIWVFAGRTVTLLVLSWGGSNVTCRHHVTNSALCYSVWSNVKTDHKCLLLRDSCKTGLGVTCRPSVFGVTWQLNCNVWRFVTAEKQCLMLYGGWPTMFVVTWPLTNSFWCYLAAAQQCLWRDDRQARDGKQNRLWRLTNSVWCFMMLYDTMMTVAKQCLMFLATGQ